MGLKLQTIGESRRFLLRELKDIYTPGEASAIASFLVEWVTNLSLSEQLKDGNRELCDEESLKIQMAGIELKHRKPVQYIAGYAWFMERRFRVEPGVLIPRQETEELVAMAITRAGRSFAGNIIDFCTGTGCIAVTLSVIMPAAGIWATELSDKALEIAHHNISAYNAGVTLLRRNLLRNEFTGLPMADILLANPPYVRSSERSSMDPGVLQYEPPEALFVPDDNPLLFYHPLLLAVRDLLRPGGWFCFEINEALGSDVASLFTHSFISEISIINDIHSKNRFITGTRAG